MAIKTGIMNQLLKKTASRWAVVAALAGCLIYASSTRAPRAGDTGTANEPNQTRSPSFDAKTQLAASTSDEPLPALPGFSNERFMKQFHQDLERLDPTVDGWDTEAFSEKVMEQLKKIGHLISGHADQPVELGSVLADDFVCDSLRPKRLVKLFGGRAITVRGMIESADHPAADYLGRHGLAESIKQLLSPFPSHDLHAHFKLFRVNQDGNSVNTSLYFQLGGTTANSGLHVNATWHCRWENAAGDVPRLSHIRVAEYNETFCTDPQGRSAAYSDCTEAVIGKTDAYRFQLTPGLDYWCRTMDRHLGLDISGMHGLAIGDVDNDGLDDVYLCEPGGLPNRLLLHKSDGTARDISAVAGVDFLETTRSALFVDLDNDGDQDLVIASDRFVIFLSNDGFGRFYQRSAFRTTSSVTSLAAADYDLDNDLDVYVCGYFTMEDAAEGTMGLGNPIPFHDANNGGRNFFYRNEGNWRFLDATEEVGLDVDNRRFSFAATWEDYDNDGDPDLYVANDYGRNCLYRNDNGRFVNVAAQSGVEDMSSGMSASWGDFNRDGRLDLYVSNMFSSAGNRIAYQRQFKATDDDKTRSQFQRFARGNSLFENVGDGTFSDVSVSSGVTLGRWAWCSNFVDINNDGWEDLLVANGMLTRDEDTSDL
jgi:hypothetical protein